MARRIGIRRLGLDLLNHRAILVINITLDPIAWAKKYLIEASVSWFIFVDIINGINDRRFSSIPSHKKIQFVLEIAINDLIIMVNVAIMENGLIIKI